VTTANSESSTERIPGRVWTIRLTGHSDRFATVTCSNEKCRMPPRSRDVAALRTFAQQHAAAHAKAAAASIRSNARCHCGSQRCAAHEAKVRCEGAVVMILRHDRAVRRVWSIEEVCERCAPLIPNATIVARSAKPNRPAQRPAPQVSAPARPGGVPVGFSSVATSLEDRPTPVRSRRAPHRSPRRRSGQGR
jgi:hypothetical protein